MIWIPYIAQEYLKIILHPDMKVFEYGCGDSTIFFSQLANEVVSVEHDKKWYDKIQQLHLSNVKLIYAPFEMPQIGDDKANPSHYKSGAMDGNFKNYVDTFLKNITDDLIFIDGRARASCLTLAFAYQPKWIVLDNSERGYYTQMNPTPDNYETIKFYGWGPKNNYAWETTFYKRR